MSFDLDRWKGCLYGQAIGDALGIPLEFKSSMHIALKFPDGFDMKYRKTVRWGMDPAWRAGEFSDDTWQAIKIIQAYLDTLEQQEGQHPFGFDFDLFASNLAQGFIAWVNEDGRGCGTHTGKVFAHPSFWLDPIESSRQVWENSGRRSAANGAAMRASVCGMLRPWDIEFTIRIANVAAEVTHYDPKCVASAVCIAGYVADSIMGDTNQAAIDDAMVIAQDMIPDHTAYIDTMTLDEINLDEGMGDPNGPRPPIGFTLKALGAGFWAVRRAYHYLPAGMMGDMRYREPEPLAALQEVIEAGGDVDTNAAIAGAMLGSRSGASVFPDELRDGLVQKELIDSLLDRLHATFPDPIPS